MIRNKRERRERENKMLTIEMFCASVLFLFLSVYACCYAKNIVHMRRQDIEFTKLLKELDECDRIEQEYKKYENV